MQREMHTPTSPTARPHSHTRKWKPLMLDQIICHESHPGDDATGLMEWLALWQAPRGTLL